MRIFKITPLVLILMTSATLSGGDDVPPVPTIQFHIAGKQPDESTKAAVLQLGLAFLKSSNFNTVNDPQLLGQSVPVIHDHYRSAVTSDYVLIRYDHPITVKTMGGDVTVYDIVIGLARPEYASSLFTVDDQGRVVAHEKYSGGLAIEIKKAVSRNAN